MSKKTFFLMGLSLMLTLPFTTAYGQNACVGNKVFQDLNGNDVRDLGEPGVADVSVHLLDNQGVELSMTQTDAKGRFTFCDLTAGSYRIKYDLPTGFQSFVTPFVGAIAYDSNADSDGLTNLFSIQANHQNFTFDAGLIGMDNPTMTACIGNQIFNDLNTNSTRDIGEPGVPNVWVHLLTAQGQELGMTQTNVKGRFSFCGLAAGSYRLKYDLPAGFQAFVTPFVGAIAYDSNVDADGLTNVVTIQAGHRNFTFDAGVWETLPVQTGCIGNLLFHDLNRNGIHNVGEPGVPNRYIQLETPDQVYITHTYTDENGMYQFCDLLTGQYVIKFTIPSGFPHFSNQNEGNDDNIDSDAHKLLGRTEVINLAPGQMIDNIDAGLISTKLGICPQPVSATISSIMCDGDNSFTFDVTATGGSDLGWNGNGTTGNVYGVPTNIGSFPLDYGSATITVFNAQYSNCFQNITVWAPTCIGGGGGAPNQNLLANTSSSVTVYPNPATNLVKIDVSSFGNTNVNVNIYDALGRIVSTQKVDDAAATIIEINTSQWPIGLYFVRTFNEKGAEVATRLLIER